MKIDYTFRIIQYRIFFFIESRETAQSQELAFLRAIKSHSNAFDLTDIRSLCDARKMQLSTLLITLFTFSNVYRIVNISDSLLVHIGAF